MSLATDTMTQESGHISQKSGHSCQDDLLLRSVKALSTICSSFSMRLQVRSDTVSRKSSLVFLASRMSVWADMFSLVEKGGRGGAPGKINQTGHTHTS